MEWDRILENPEHDPADLKKKITKETEIMPLEKIYKYTILKYLKHSDERFNSKSW